MKAALIQRQLKLNCDVLTGLHEEYNALRRVRKEFNEEADKCALEALEHAEKEDFAMAGNVNSLAEGNREMAARYTPYVKMFRKKIAKLEEVQRALKAELKSAQVIEMLVEVDPDSDWKQLAQIAQQED